MKRLAITAFSLAAVGFLAFGYASGSASDERLPASCSEPQVRDLVSKSLAPYALAAFVRGQAVPVRADQYTTFGRYWNYLDCEVLVEYGRPGLPNVPVRFRAHVTDHGALYVRLYGRYGLW